MYLYVDNIGNFTKYSQGNVSIHASRTGMVGITVAMKHETMIMT